ncbi:MAG: hypothetical protein EXR78_02120 [Deltaproteobacteria bacterium]|nr:hypothetical protein [Deltaproteobacteria bacterium]
MVEHQKNSTRWGRLAVLLRKTFWWQRVKHDHLPIATPPPSAVHTVNEEEIRKRLEGLGYLE